MKSYKSRNSYMPKLVEVGNQVEHMLKVFPQTRISDKRLEVMVWMYFYSIRTLKDLIRSDIPPSSSIRRWRRRIQNDWKRYEPSLDFKRRQLNNMCDYIKEFTDAV